MRSKIRHGALQDASSTYALRGVQLQFLQEISLLAISKKYRGWKRPTLLIVGFDEASSTHIGALQPCRQLGEQGFLRFSWVQPPYVTEQHLDGVHGVYVVRAFQPEVLPLLDWAREKNVPVISSWDDDLCDVPSGTLLGDYCRQPEVVHARKRFLAESHLVVASTPPLMKRSREFSDCVVEALYGLDAAELSVLTQQASPRALADGKVRIGFYGANAAVNEAWMIEALKNLRDRYDTRIILEVIGSTPPTRLRAIIDWYSDTLLPYKDSMQLLWSRGWDIGLAPLADTPFNAVKQATKFRDYTWAGAAIVCSQVPAYERVLIDGIHCLFAKNISSAWETVIASLIENPSKANFLRQGAKKLLASVHTQEMTNAAWKHLSWRVGVAAALASAPPLSGATVYANGYIEDVGSPPLGYEPFLGTLRYCLIPRRPCWKGVKVFVCSTSLREVKSRLVFRICLKNGLVIREGETSFEARNEASWVQLDFPELQHANGQTFILELRLQEPAWTTQVGLFETRHTRSRVRRGARVLGVSPVNRNLFAQLVYTR